MTNRMLNTADPTIVPIPTSFLAMKTPMMEVKSSGADPPAAMKVAPATSGLICNWKKKYLVSTNLESNVLQMRGQNKDFIYASFVSMHQNYPSYCSCFLKIARVIEGLKKSSPIVVQNSQSFTSHGTFRIMRLLRNRLARMTFGGCCSTNNDHIIVPKVLSEGDEALLKMGPPIDSVVTLLRVSYIPILLNHAFENS